MAKIRQGFVSNSSSSSFILRGFLVDKNKYTQESLLQLMNIMPDEDKIQETFERYNYNTREDVIEDIFYDKMFNYFDDIDLFFGASSEDGCPDKDVYMIGEMLYDSYYDDTCDTQIIDGKLSNAKLQAIQDKLGLEDSDVKIICGERCC